jgi:hypothetical protein
MVRQPSGDSTCLVQVVLDLRADEELLLLLLPVLQLGRGAAARAESDRSASRRQNKQELALNFISQSMQEQSKEEINGQPNETHEP